MSARRSFISIRGVYYLWFYLDIAFYFVGAVDNYAMLQIFSTRQRGIELWRSPRYGVYNGTDAMKITKRTNTSVYKVNGINKNSATVFFIYLVYRIAAPN